MTDLTVAQAAELLAMHPVDVRLQARRGLLPHRHTGTTGRLVRIIAEGLPLGIGDRALRAGEVAGILRCSPACVIGLVDRGELGGFRIGRRVRITKSGLVAYIESHRDTGAAWS